jgi:hypothetical protein
MPDYAIEVRYGNGQPTVRIPLLGYSPDDAEVDLQAVREELRHASELNAPCVIRELSAGPLAEHVEIPVDGAIEVDLVDADAE